MKRLKALEEENLKLMQMYATLALDHQMANAIITKTLSPIINDLLAKHFPIMALERRAEFLL